MRMVPSSSSIYLTHWRLVVPFLSFLALTLSLSHSVSHYHMAAKTCFRLPYSVYIHDYHRETERRKRALSVKPVHRLNEREDLTRRTPPISPLFSLHLSLSSLYSPPEKLLVPFLLLLRLLMFLHSSKKK